MDGLIRLPPNPLRFILGPQVFNPGFPAGPRTNLESQGACPRVWPVVYRVPLRGVGNLGLFQLGPTLPVFNNALAGGAPGYNVMMPGLGKNPFGG
jgi:hypothetical protein